ncbi:MAG: nitroreductase, partial [Rhodothermales bacterium]|nr:nitroreductase [Rhodothermales bacterium]
MGEDPWTTRQEDFWLLDDPEARSRFVVNYAVLAPSAQNTQPWMFAADRREIDLFADRRRGLAVSDPDDRQLTISCGSALFFLTLAMRRFGRLPVVHTFPDLSNPDHLARVRWGVSKQPTPEVERLFEAITHPSVQVPMVSQKAPEERLISEILADLHSPGISVTRVLDKSERAVMSELTAEAKQIQSSDGRFRREWETWNHPDRKLSRDGWPQKPKSRGRSRRNGRAGSSLKDPLCGDGPALVV